MRRIWQPGVVSAVVGVAALAVAAVLLPLAGDGFSAVAQIVAFAFALAPTAFVLHGFLAAAGGLSTRRVLISGAVAAFFGFAISLLLRNPEGWPALLLGVALLLANVLRLAGAAAVGISLARNVQSAGVALLIALVATGADLFSVFAGPTRALLKGDSAALDLLLLVFPVFGEPYGFALGLSDFIFLALFAGMARYLGLRYFSTLGAVCAGAFLAIVVGLLLEMPLPALPFISVAFLLVNGDLIIADLRGSWRSRRKSRVR